MIKSLPTRRTALASFAVPLLGQLARGRGAESTIQLGCQTNAWPIRPGDSNTLFKALEDIKQLGFAGFETGFANVLPMAQRPEELKEHAEGLTLFGVHIFLLHYDPATSVAPPELVSKVAALGAKMGFQRLILSGAPAADQSAQKQKAEALNRYGREVKSLGMKLAYHNHGPEFKGADPEIEGLLADTDPSLVWFLLDAGHAFDAGADVVAFVNRHYGRLTGLHLRDYKNGKQVPLGEGDFPLAAVAGALRRNHWSGWALAEEERLDGSKPGDAAAGPAFESLRKAFAI